MQRLAIEAQRFELAMRGDEQSAAGCFVRAARFHADETIFDNVHAADAIGCGDFIQLIEQRERREFLAVHGDGIPGFEADFDGRGLVGRFRGRDDPFPHVFGGRVGRIFEHAALVAQVPDVAVAAVDVFLGLIDGDVVRARVFDGIFARIDFPFAPRRDDLKVGCERFGGQLKTDLVVALAGAAVGQRVRADFPGDLDLPLRKERAGERRAQQIFVLVDGSGTERGPDVAGDELLAQIFRCTRRSLRWRGPSCARLRDLPAGRDRRSWR